MVQGQAAEEVLPHYLWCNTPAIRDAVAAVVDPALSSLTFISLPDGTGGRIRYERAHPDDRAQKVLLYRRDLVYSVESTAQISRKRRRKSRRDHQRVRRHGRKSANRNHQRMRQSRTEFAVVTSPFAGRSRGEVIKDQAEIDESAGGQEARSHGVIVSDHPDDPTPLPIAPGKKSKPSQSRDSNRNRIHTRPIPCPASSSSKARSTLNAQIVPNLIVQIVPPSFTILNGVPTNIVGIVGTATWGPVNSPTIASGHGGHHAPVRGGLRPARVSTLAPQFTRLRLPKAVRPALRVVAVTDGTDTAASTTVTPIRRGHARREVAEIHGLHRGNDRHRHRRRDIDGPHRQRTADSHRLRHQPRQLHQPAFQPGRPDHDLQRRHGARTFNLTFPTGITLTGFYTGSNGNNLARIPSAPAVQQHQRCSDVQRSA